MPGKRIAWIAAAAVTLALALPASASAALSLVKVGDFTDPTFVTAPPADPHRLLVVERTGTIQILRDGVRKATPFVDLSSAVTTSGEAGMLSMAFAPDYATSGRFYVDYTAPRAGDPDGTVVTIASMRRSSSNPDVADPSSLRTILTVDHPGSPFHDGGQLQFGPDGLLYISVGDGGFGDDPANNAQNTHLLLGKILRIRPTPGKTFPYQIPAGNPFADGKDGAREIWQYGLRNPWRFSFDRVSGDLLVADVGQADREEVDWTAKDTGAGLDYGWHCREGSIATPNVNPCTPSGTYAPPVFDYDHSSGRCAIVGGYLVRNHDLGSLYGRYVYSDYCTGDIRSLALARPTVTDDQDTGLSLPQFASFGEDSCGHIYVAAQTGEVDRLAGDSFTPCPEPTPPVRDVTPPHLGLTVAPLQRLDAARGVKAEFRCNELCVVKVDGDVFVPKTGARYPIAELKRTFAAGQQVQLAIPVSKEGAEAATAAAAQGHRVWVHLVVTGSDASGNSTRHFRSTRLIG